MRAIFLGTGGYHPNARRHTAGLMLPECGVVFDAGTSFFRVQELLARDSLDIFVTHAHLDHICGLTYFLIPMLQGMVKTACLHANRPTLDAIRNRLFDRAVFPVDVPYQQRELAGPVPIAGGAKVSFQPLPGHPGGSTAFRIDWPASGRRKKKSLAYVTDTTTDGSYLKFIRGVDVLIHECNFPDSLSEWCEPTGHSCTTPVAQAAKRAKVGRLILTHIDPQRAQDDPIGLETARAIFPATTLAEDLMEVEF